jgi:hypothetical protein
MRTKKLSADEQLALRESARLELIRLETIIQSQETTELLDKFKNRFNICETVYKILLKKHQDHKGKKTTTFLKVSMTQVPHVLTFAGYSFDVEMLNELFGASGKNGTTVKKLRDAVTHGISPKAIEEIISRQEELFGYMDSFLNVIRTLDDVA